MSWLPIALVAVPLLGALAAFVRAVRDSAVAWGIAVSAAVLVLAAALAALFDYARPAEMQLQTDQPWIPGLGLRFHLGVDGVSLPLVVLTALLTLLCFVHLAGHPPEGGRTGGLVVTLLVLEVGMLGTFLALDLLLFFVFFEVVLVPMYFVIALWGGAGRRVAAVKFILYTLLGSAVLLIGLLVVWTQAGTLDMVALADRHGSGIARSAQILAFLAIGLGLAVKTPMWPLHTWLPDAHTEAPTVGSVLLAGVLLKMGSYGFARIAIPVLPEGAAALAPWLGAFAVAGIAYGSLACLAQRDLKRMIAYSSVGHMGFVLLGFASLTPVGMNGALFANVAHGLITGLLFFLAGAVKERYGTADMVRLGGGMLRRLPYVGSLLTFACVASLGLPGLAGFWGEMLALLGAFRPAAGLSRPLFLVFMAVGGLGTVLTAAYFLVMLSRVTHGRAVETVSPAAPLQPAPLEPAPLEPAPLEPAPLEPAGPLESARPGATGAAGAAVGVDTRDGAEPGQGRRRFRDATTHELAAWLPLVALIMLFGLWPKALLAVTTPAVQSLLGSGAAP
ncbi:NADH-quinone oxidoreductase subunit M [Microbispora sp. SCL1-1]|uniref:complex I subunit 4 family protein n=1 Tax=unclassified Microbispora TaxID=2614687 RepID=UPI00115B7DD5|nr:NADH-quinone oxidoreductase subunit M [Microbispora sp. SCL1-1]NJP29857.1 NADH-quinone oxidoreductase subunit M [Microbispora sp. CL1-1]TQS03854.1 NADH-quinone oxidoreductase subunit M [Microbispora sp. SCL1-1]